MPWTPDNLTVKGALAAFHQSLEVSPAVYANHCMTIKSTTDTEAFVFPGFQPTPRQFLDSRQFQGARDFRYNVTNNEYELSMVTTRKTWEDDQTGLINARYSETGEVWGAYKDSLFSTLLTAGDGAGLGWDGTTFHSNSHTAIGGSGVFKNKPDTITGITDSTGLLGGMTTANAQSVIGRIRFAFVGFNDDQGRPFNFSAIRNMRAVIPAGHERAVAEASSASIVVNTSNVYIPAILQGYDVLPYLTTQTELYFSALGSVRKPFIYQERTPLEVIVLTSPDAVALHNGVMLLTRQRFVLTYGEPRRSILQVVSA